MAHFIRKTIETVTRYEVWEAPSFMEANGNSVMQASYIVPSRDIKVVEDFRPMTHPEFILYSREKEDS